MATSTASPLPRASIDQPDQSRPSATRLANPHSWCSHGLSAFLSLGWRAVEFACPTHLALPPRGMQQVRAALASTRAASSERHLPRLRQSRARRIRCVPRRRQQSESEAVEPGDSPEVEIQVAISVASEIYGRSTDQRVIPPPPSYQPSSGAGSPPAPFPSHPTRSCTGSDRYLESRARLHIRTLTLEFHLAVSAIWNLKCFQHFALSAMKRWTAGCRTLARSRAGADRRADT